MDPEQLQSYAAGWRRREAEDRREAQLLACEARAFLPALVDLLVKQHGARRVVLFGSLAEGSFGPGSDIDLAVEGLATDWFIAWADAERALHGRFRLDLVPLELARPALLAGIARGEVLHGER